MKKLIGLLMVMVLLLTLTSCERKNEETEKYCWNCGADLSQNNYISETSKNESTVSKKESTSNASELVAESSSKESESTSTDISKTTTITLPTLPQEVHEFGDNGTPWGTTKITNITYEIKNERLYLYFTGEKIYGEGDYYLLVPFKLYDSEGYVIHSDIFYTPSIKKGEKFKNQKTDISIPITLGESYKLVLEDDH